MADTYHGGGENKRGFHNPPAVTDGPAQGGESGKHGGAAGRKARTEPTNHGGHTHEMTRRREADARIEAVRRIHTGKGYGHVDHHGEHGGGTERVSQSKYGAAHHFRDGE